MTILIIFRLNENNLPDINLFYSKFNISEWKDKDYRHAKSAYKAFKCIKHLRLL